MATSESNCNDLLRVWWEHEVPEIMICTCIVIHIAEALCDIRYLFLTMLNFYLKDSIRDAALRFKFSECMSEPTAHNVQLCRSVHCMCILSSEMCICLLIALFSFFLLASYLSAHTSSAHTKFIVEATIMHTQNIHKWSSVGDINHFMLITFNWPMGLKYWKSAISLKGEWH